MTFFLIGIVVQLTIAHSKRFIGCTIVSCYLVLFNKVFRENNFFVAYYVHFSVYVEITK